MISNLRKFCQFCLIILVAAVATVMLLSSHSLKERSSTASTLMGTIELPLQQIVTPSPELAWSETGATVLPLAAQIMLMRIRQPRLIAIAFIFAPHINHMIPIYSSYSLTNSLTPSNASELAASVSLANAISRVTMRADKLIKTIPSKNRLVQ